MNVKLKPGNGENHTKLDNENEEWKIRLDRETAELRSEWKESKKELQSEIDGNFFSNTNRINELAQKFTDVCNNASSNKDDLLLKMQNEVKLLRELVGQPLSVYFCANRSEDFISGGQNFLTFDSKFSNDILL